MLEGNQLQDSSRNDGPDLKVPNSKFQNPSSKFHEQITIYYAQGTNHHALYTEHYAEFNFLEIWNFKKSRILK
jgi:hypothetical protein